MKSIDKPLRRFRFIYTFDFLIEDITIEAVERWNQNSPPHMREEIDEEEIAVFRELQRRLMMSPKIRDWIVGWLEADIHDAITTGFEAAFHSNGDPDGQAESDVIAKMLEETRDSDFLTQFFDVTTDSAGHPHYAPYDFRYAVESHEWRPVQLIEQVFGESGNLENETTLDIPEIERDDQ